MYYKYKMSGSRRFRPSTVSGGENIFWQKKNRR